MKRYYVAQAKEINIKKVLILLLLESRAEQRLVGLQTQQQLSKRQSKSFVNEKLQCEQSIVMQTRKLFSIGEFLGFLHKVHKCGTQHYIISIKFGCN